VDFKDCDIVSVNQFDLDGLNSLFDLARRLKPVASGKVKSKILDGYILGNLFFEPSTRTRMSFASAFMRLGGQVNSTTGVGISSMAKGETLADTITMIQTYCDVIVMRHNRLGAAQEAAAYSSVPVINAGDGVGEHPTQALQDLFTIFEERPGRNMDGMTIALVGDLKFGRCPHSLVNLLSLYSGIRFIFVAPPELQMPEPFVSAVRAKGFEVTQTSNLDAALKEADVVYWTRIQDERIEDKRVLAAVRGIYVLTRAKVESCCKKNAVILHPLPRIDELHADVDDLPNAAYFRQAANSILIRMALLLMVLGKAIDFGKSMGRDEVPDASALLAVA
jgi:aspartate carbamoyltransferase catalytic subunit